MRAFWLRLRRPLRFAVVGGFCFVVQGGVLFSLGLLGLPLAVANAVGFVASAQLNYALSALFTWRDRPAGQPRRVVARWVSYQATTAFSLGVNTVTFMVALPLAGALAAAAIGVLVGMGANFVLSHFVVFRAVRHSASPLGAHPPGAGGRPDLGAHTTPEEVTV